MSSNEMAGRDVDLAKLQDALKMLFDLLEAYAPMWYTKEHRDKVLEALRCGQDGVAGT
jgi:hypothetical protein